MLVPNALKNNLCSLGNFEQWRSTVEPIETKALLLRIASNREWQIHSINLQVIDFMKLMYWRRE